MTGKEKKLFKITTTYDTKEVNVLEGKKNFQIVDW